MHKWASAISLGINCVKKEISKKSAIVCMAVFSIATPLGVLFGAILNDFNEWIAACFLCVSCGTFIYIGVTEILFAEFSVTKFKYRKFASFSAGFLQALILTIFF